jgi:hypothetical protein
MARGGLPIVRSEPSARRATVPDGADGRSPVRPVGDGPSRAGLSRDRAGYVRPSVELWDPSGAVGAASDVGT